MNCTKLNILKLRPLLATVALSAMFSTTFAVSASAQQMSKPQTAKTSAARLKSLSEDQKILHVLNRLGYGARPGDVEKVKQIGIEKYIEQQLNSSQISDPVAESKVKNLEVLRLSNAELFAGYPNGAGVLSVLSRENGKSVRQLKAERRGAAEMKQTEGAAMMKPGDNMAENMQEMSQADRQKYRQQINQLYRKYDLRQPNQITQQLNASRILRAVYSERQLQEQMVDFWTNHFNVFAGKAATRWFLPEYDRDVIRPNALGNFRELLTATAKSPAMLFYLDNFQSVAENNNQNANGRNVRLMERIEKNGGALPPRQRERMKERLGLTDEQLDQRLKQMQQRAANQKKQRRGINENYARELMELHTLGVDGGYTQKDIQEIARAFTGWTIVDPRGYRRVAAKLGDDEAERGMRGMQRLAGLPDGAESGTFFFNERQHDKGEKTILGQKIPAGGGIEDGLKVIDILVKHPSTAKFIARKLAVKFVSDNPSEELVNRVAAAFQKSNGDVKTTLRALFASPEFFAPENYRAKIKTPFEVLASAIRTLGADTNASPAMQAMLAKMGEPLYGYQAPTGYPDTAEDWVNTGALLERLNFGLAIAANRIPGTRVDLTRFAGKDPDNKEKVMETFLSIVLHGEVSDATKATLKKQLNQTLPEVKLTAVADTEDAMMENASLMQGGGKGRRGQNGANRLLPASGNPEVIKIVGLILGSPEFQRQ